MSDPQKGGNVQQWQLFTVQHSKDAKEKQKMKHNPRVDAMLPSCTLIHMTILHIDAEQLTLMPCTMTPSCTLILLPLLAPS